MSAEASQLIYFVSGMWCSTCAKNIRESVVQLEGVESADLNYTSKLLLVRPKPAIESGPLDESIQTKVTRIGFGIKKQSEGWILNFHESLKHESNRKIPWTLISVVWFLAMWSSMLAFASYLGELSQTDLYALALASSAFGLPAILLGIIPFGKSGLRALWFSKLLTLDFFIFFGGLSALTISVIALLSRSNITYADSGSMIVAILLLTKKIENTIATTLTSNILFQLHPKKKTVEVFRKEQWVHAEVSQIKRGDLVRILPQETLSFDGVLESESGEINNHLMSGEAHAVRLKKGDHIFAGAIAQSEIKLSVTSPQGERKIDSWAETAILSENNKSQHMKLFSKIESGLVIFAFGGAILIAGVQALKGAETRLIVESFFVGILIFCPCLFASIIPLMKQMVHLALLKRGIMLSRADALLDLAKVTNFFFDKTGTLEAIESDFVPLSEDGEHAIPYLNSLAERSKHPILRGLKVTGGLQSIEKIIEHPGKGLEAIAGDGAKILVGRSSFLKEMGLEISSESECPLVAINQAVVGQIIIKSVYDSNSHQFLKKLLNISPSAKIEILSGDPSSGAGTSFTKLDQRISYFGNLTPEEKAERIQGASAFVGDGLNDTLALAKSRVSFRVGHRIFGFAPVDFHLQSPNLDLILAAIEFSKKYRKVLIQTGCAALLYNSLALTLAGLGQFSPLGAVLSMLASFSVMLLSVSRLSKVHEVRK
ncbi:MAG: cation-translocating P-type ATPase [Bdellovibrionaceae bacterium]|nr:cation-translocating P-type ATPase [Pseudobdellovibrionaceae bacterium]